MTLKIQGLNDQFSNKFVEISGKDNDSIGTSEREIFMISMSFHCSEGAVDM